MRIVVRADDGDQITVKADDITAEQRIVTLEFHNLTFNEIEEFESIALTVDRARELATALATIAATVDDVTADSKPVSFPASQAGLGLPKTDTPLS